MRLNQIIKNAQGKNGLSFEFMGYSPDSGAAIKDVHNCEDIVATLRNGQYLHIKAREIPIYQTLGVQSIEVPGGYQGQVQIADRLGTRSGTYYAQEKEQAVVGAFVDAINRIPRIPGETYMRA
jgi:hypothetical protein